jgi:hypothetical protein
MVSLPEPSMVIGCAFCLIATDTLRLTTSVMAELPVMFSIAAVWLFSLSSVRRGVSALTPAVSLSISTGRLSLTAARGDPILR